jgi:hypothetical protein
MMKSPTSKEMDLIREYILFPHMIETVERSREEIEQSRTTLRSLISRFLDVLQQTINADLVNVRIAMSKANIKVWDDDQQGDVLYYRYRCRGVEDRLGIDREEIRSKKSARLAKYGLQILPGPESLEVSSDQPVVH